jgi:hypothetical protein
MRPHSVNLAGIVLHWLPRAVATGLLTAAALGGLAFLLSLAAG